KRVFVSPSAPILRDRVRYTSRWDQSKLRITQTPPARVMTTLMPPPGRRETRCTRRGTGAPSLVPEKTIADRPPGAEVGRGESCTVAGRILLARVDPTLRDHEADARRRTWAFGAVFSAVLLRC